MTVGNPFSYSVVPHVRKHGPRGYTNYPDYKPWLRDEFAFRCVYCLEREQWYPRPHGSFSVDHVLPQSTHPELICDYSNLVYCCCMCNSFKRAALLCDPTQVAFADHLAMGSDGLLVGLTAEGRYLIDLLHLNDDRPLEARRYALNLIALKAELPDNQRVHEVFVSYFGYPSDLPNLSALRPPNGNGAPDGIEGSFYALQAEGKLPEVY